MEGLDEAMRKKIGRDDYKPQFLSFRNPILVRLFEKLVEKAPRTLTVSEMLPDTADLAAFGENHYVTEFVVQWDTGPGVSQ